MSIVQRLWRSLLVAFVFAIVATACDSDTRERGERVIGTWVLEGLAFDGAAVPVAADLAETSIRFVSGGQFQGQAPCNDFAGLWSFSGESLAISVLARSVVACVDPGGGASIMEADHAIMRVLSDAGRFSTLREGDVLELWRWDTC